MLKTKLVTIESLDRDAGKTFLLTEKNSYIAEMWASRAFNGMARAHVEIPDSVVGSGMVGVWVMGIKMLFAMDFAVCRELLDEMMECVQYMPDPKMPEVLRPIIGSLSIASDIEEVTTRLKLRDEVFALHSGFTLAEGLSKLTSALKPAAPLNTETSQGSSPQ